MSEETQVDAEIPEGAEASPEDLSEDVAYVDTAVELIKSDKIVQGAATMLLLSRRLYFMAAADMEGRLRELQTERMTEVGEYLAEAMRERSREPFQREEVLAALKDFALPWILAGIEGAAAKEQEEFMAEALSVEEQRRATALEFPSLRLKTTSGEFLESVTRGKPLVLIGNSAVTTELAQVILQEAIRQVPPPGVPQMRTLHLSGEPTRINSKAKDATALVVGSNQWRRAARNYKAICNLLRRWLGMLRNHGCDLLVVDDLALFAEDSTGPLWSSRCGRALQIVRRWCHAYGAASVLCLTFPCDMTAETREKFVASLSQYADISLIESVREKGSQFILSGGENVVADGSAWS